MRYSLLHLLDGFYLWKILASIPEEHSYFQRLLPYPYTKLFREYRTYSYLGNRRFMEIRMDAKIFLCEYNRDWLIVESNHNLYGNTFAQMKILFGEQLQRRLDFVATKFDSKGVKIIS